MLLFILVPTAVLQAGPGRTLLLSDLDIPLMRGFHEDKASRVLFDTPEGRIVEVRASGPSGAVRVFDYYRRVLPSLSWHRIGNKIKNCRGLAVFCITAHRDSEILTIRIRELKQPPTEKTIKTTVYFSVNPK